MSQTFKILVDITDKQAFDMLLKNRPEQLFSIEKTEQGLFLVAHVEASDLTTVASQYTAAQLLKSFVLLVSGQRGILRDDVVKEMAQTTRHDVTSLNAIIYPGTTKVLVRPAFLDLFLRYVEEQNPNGLPDNWAELFRTTVQKEWKERQ